LVAERDGPHRRFWVTVRLQWRSDSSRPSLYRCDKALPQFGGTLTRRWNWQLAHYFLFSSCNRVDDLDVSQPFSWAELHFGEGGSAARAFKNHEAIGTPDPSPYMRAEEELPSLRDC